MPKFESKQFSVTVTFSREDLSELSDLVSLAEMYIDTKILPDKDNQSGQGRKNKVERWFKHIAEWNK